MSTETVIECRQVSKNYITREGVTPALENISFTVEKGEFITLLGPSGCGKSTILSLLSGLIRPSTGSVLVRGREVIRPLREVGYMLQQDYLLGWRTIKQNVQLGLEFQHKRIKEHEEDALSLLNEMGLSAYLHYYPGQLSGGMRQRVALARTLATNPDLLLLDEPFSALDFSTRLRLEDLVIDTLRKKNKTAVFVTHDISEAIAMSDRIIILTSQPGRIKKILDIPPVLRDPLPFDTRDIPEFQTYFQYVWKVMNEHESETSTTSYT